MNKQRKWIKVFEKHPTLTLVIFLLVLTSLIDLISGLIWIPKDENEFRTFHPYYHHGLLPDQNNRPSWGPFVYQMYTNNLGLRDRANREVELKADRYRILLMGDSHTEGVGVNFEDSFAGILAARGDSAGIEILNGGVVSYSPKLYYLRTQYLLEKAGLDVDAIYMLIDISDIQNEIAYEHFQPQEKSPAVQLGKRLTNFFQKRSFLFYSLRKWYLDRQRKTFYQAVTQQRIEYNNTVDLYQSFFSGFDDQVLLSNPDFHTTLSEWYSDTTLYERWGKKGARLMAENMLKLVELCRDKHIDLTISVHPWRNNIQKGNTNDRHVAYWRNFANQHKINFLNLYPVFINGQEADSVIQRYFFPEDNHWNAKGHQRIAAKLGEHIMTQYQNRENKDTSYFAAWCALELHQYDKAIARSGQVLATFPDHSNAYAMRGISLLKTGRFDRAQLDLQKAHPKASFWLNTAYYLENFSLHETIYFTSLALNDQESDSLYVQRGEAYFSLKNFQLAQNDFFAANKINTRNKKPYYYLGMIENRYLHNYSQASTYLNRAIQIDPFYVEAYRERSAVLSTLGNTFGARRDSVKAQELSQKLRQ